jgi:hypothetical protein
MKWYFFYTPNYHFYKNHIETRLANSKFTAEPILVKELVLSDTLHHFLNNTIKVELVLDCIKKNMGSHIIFSDATIYINDKINEFYDYIDAKTNTDYDMYFTKEYGHNNIGYILLNCNDATLMFWENVLTTMNEKIKNNIITHDQVQVNILLENATVKAYTFEQEYVWCSDYIYSPIKESFYVFKITIDLNSPISRHNQRMNTLYNLRFISDQEYYTNLE